MINGIIPTYFYERCVKCGYKQIHETSCTTMFMPCPKCGGNMEKLKKVSKPTMVEQAWVFAQNTFNVFGKK